MQWSQPSFLTALNGTSERSEVECLLERASSDVPRLSRDPSVKKLLSMRRLGTRLGILLRIFPSSRNAFRPSSQDLERSVVMARR